MINDSPVIIPISSACYSVSIVRRFLLLLLIVGCRSASWLSWE